jgi:hypothetical protein
VATPQQLRTDINGRVELKNDPSGTLFDNT